MVNTEQLNDSLKNENNLFRYIVNINEVFQNYDDGSKLVKKKKKTRKCSIHAF